jgi:hypothetical protein
MNSSIVQKVISRSITGHKIGIDMHSHCDSKVHLCWESKPKKKCIQRHDEDDVSKFDKILKNLNDPGIDRVCSCAINISSLDKNKIKALRTW